MVRRLKRRAADNHRSTTGEVRNVLKEAVEDDMPARRSSFRDLPRYARRGHMDREGALADALEVLIRNDRDSGHRRIPSTL